MDKGLDKGLGKGSGNLGFRKEFELGLDKGFGQGFGQDLGKGLVRVSVGNCLQHFPVCLMGRENHHSKNPVSASHTPVVCIN